MSDTDVFAKDAVTPTAEISETTTDPVILKRLTDKDAFINQLKGELAELKNAVKPALDAQTQLEALRLELKELREKGVQPKENTTPALTVTDVQTLVEQTVTAREQNRTANENVAEANSNVVKFFGTMEKAQAAVQAKAQELGVPMSMMKEVAAKSPTAFYNLLGVAKTSSNAGTGGFIEGSVKTGVKVVAPSGDHPVEGSKAYFEKIRKEQPKVYSTPRIQQQILKAAKAGTYF